MNHTSSLPLHEPERSPPSGTLIYAVLALAGALLYAVWILYSPQDPRLGFMRLPEALAIAVAASALLAFATGRRSGFWKGLRWSGGMALIAIGSIRLLAWLQSPEVALLQDPGRFPPIFFTITAALGVAVILLGTRTLRFPPVQLLALTALALIYFSASSNWFQLGNWSPGELASAALLRPDAALALLTLTLLFLSPGGLHTAIAPGSAGGLVVRRVLPVVLILPVVFGGLRLAAQRGGLFGLEVGLALMVTISTVIILGLLLLIAIRLNASNADRDDAQRVLARTNRQLERRVAIRTARLNGIIEELESFTYSVSHDLRTPLRSIEGFSRLLTENNSGQLSDQSQNHLARICAATQRMGRLIDDLLSLSRLSRRSARRTLVDLSQMAEELIEELRAGEPERRVEVRIEPDMTAVADLELTRMVMTNLLGNAWKFTSKIEHATIEFDTCTTDTLIKGETVFRLTDNGAGFDMQYVSKVFEAFQRLHRENEFPGNGIGLATVKRIIGRHGGRIWAISEPNKGACFQFTLPAELDDDDDLTQSHSSD